MLKYARCERLVSYLELLVSEIDELGHLNNVTIGFVVSKRARSKALGRIYGLPRAIQVAHNLKPMYTIEFLCENIERLSPKDFSVVFFHEILHIPRGTAGGLRPHGRLVNNRKASILSSRINNSIREKMFREVMECCGRL